MEAEILLRKVFSAAKAEDVFSIRHYKKEYAEMVKLLHPDVCQLSLAGEAGIVVKGKCQVCTPFQSNFGTTHYNSTDVQKYMVQRAATFFQAILNNNTYQDFETTKFVECENFRYLKCNSTADNNEGCYKDIYPQNQICPSSETQ